MSKNQNQNKYLTQNQTPFSVYIPQSKLLTDQQISDVFEGWQIGKVSHVDRVSRITESLDTIQTLYIHFEQLYDEQNQFVHAIRNGEMRILYYSDRDYWKVFLNHSKKRTAGERKIRIQLEDETEPEIRLPIAPTLQVPHEQKTQSVYIKW